jgi:hypothetical protein
LKYFLVVFDRANGRLLRTDEFADRKTALGARFRLEREYQRADDIEIVVLGARSEEALRHTHSRYFRTASELAREGASRLNAS